MGRAERGAGRHQNDRHCDDANSKERLPLHRAQAQDALSILSRRNLMTDALFASSWCDALGIGTDPMTPGRITIGIFFERMAAVALFVPNRLRFH
jgi:hypothetical protein